MRERTRHVRSSLSLDEPELSSGDSSAQPPPGLLEPQCAEYLIKKNAQRRTRQLQAEKRSAAEIDWLQQRRRDDAHTIAKLRGTIAERDQQIQRLKAAELEDQCGQWLGVYDGISHKIDTDDDTDAQQLHRRVVWLEAAIAQLTCGQQAAHGQQLASWHQPGNQTATDKAERARLKRERNACKAKAHAEAKREERRLVQVKAQQAEVERAERVEKRRLEQVQAQQAKEALAARRAGRKAAVTAAAASAGRLVHIADQELKAATEARKALDESRREALEKLDAILSEGEQSEGGSNDSAPEVSEIDSDGASEVSGLDYMSNYSVHDPLEAYDCDDL